MKYEKRLDCALRWYREARAYRPFHKPREQWLDAWQLARSAYPEEPAQ